MYWNGLAGMLGLGVVVFALRPKQIRGGSGRRELAAALIILLPCLLLQGYFNSAIAQFGRLIRDQELQVIFRSRLSVAELLRYDRDLEQFRREIVPKIGKAKMHEIMPLVRNKIHEEALVHIFRCGRYLMENKSFVAFKELRIIEKYYVQFMRGTPLDLPAERVAQLTEAVGDSAQVLYASPVAGHLITKFREWQMWAVIAAMEAGILIYLLGFPRGWARRKETMRPEP